jgi:hypothetical protein
MRFKVAVRRRASAGEGKSSLPRGGDGKPQSPRGGHSRDVARQGGPGATGQSCGGGIVGLVAAHVNHVP